MYWRQVARIERRAYIKRLKLTGSRDHVTSSAQNRPKHGRLRTCWSLCTLRTVDLIDFIEFLNLFSWKLKKILPYSSSQRETTEAHDRWLRSSGYHLSQFRRCQVRILALRPAIVTEDYRGFSSILSIQALGEYLKLCLTALLHVLYNSLSINHSIIWRCIADLGSRAI